MHHLICSRFINLYTKKSIITLSIFQNLVVNEAIAFRKQNRIPETHFDEPSAMELDGEKDDDEKEADWKIGRLEKRRLNQQLEYNNQKKVE